MRILAAILLLLLLLPSYSTEPRRSIFGTHLVMTARPVALYPGDPARHDLGPLHYLGGVVLESPDPAFGGFSSMVVRGSRITLLSDFGTWIRLKPGASGLPALAAWGQLPGGPGTGWSKNDRDSESMALEPGGRSVLVGFEGANAIWRYDASLTRVLGHVRPPAMADWPVNLGPESLVRLKDGDWVSFAERGHWPKTRGRAAIRFTGDPVREPRRGFRFRYALSSDYAISDATLLPDGRILTIVRAASLAQGFHVKLMLFDPKAIRPGAEVHGTAIATLAWPTVHDNFEAIAAVREGGRTIIWIASDDNQSLFQKSYLLKFALTLPPS